MRKLFLIVLFVTVGLLVASCQRAEKIECVIAEPQVQETVETAEAVVEESKPTEYKVQPGDTLWAISKEHLGKGSRYPEIIEINKEALKEPDKLSVGMILKLP